MPPPIRRSIACLEGNTPTTQLRLLDLSFHTPHRAAQSLCVQGLVLSFGFCICGYSNNSCTLGDMSCFKLFYLLDHYDIYHISNQCSCNTINRTSFTSLRCFSYTTFRDTTVYGWFLEAKCMFSCVFSPIWAFSGESNHP